MSYDDAFGPPPASHARGSAIAWVRSSLFGRMRGNPHRSPFTVAIMHAAEIEAGEPATVKSRAAREALAKVAKGEIAKAMRHAEAARAGAPTELARSWAGFALAALSRVAAPAPALRVVADDGWVPPTPEEIAILRAKENRPSDAEKRAESEARWAAHQAAEAAWKEKEAARKAEAERIEAIPLELDT